MHETKNPSAALPSSARRPTARARLAIVALLLGTTPALRAQAPTLDEDRQRAIVEKTIALVKANFVYADRTAAVESALQTNLAARKYAPLVRPDDFLDALNRDLQAAGRDGHLKVINNPRIVAELKREAAGTPGDSPEYVQMLRESHYRLRKAESLDGNVGYFKFDNFVELRFVKVPLVGAMNFLAGSSALVLDLTDNGGGASETSDFLLSYFLPEGTVTGESWRRNTNVTTVSRVTRAEEVRPMLDVPVFVLVGERTASAAEAVAYTLQQARRAVIIGSTTKGLANPSERFPIDDRFLVVVPTIISKNAVSGKNWEGVGVKPDVSSRPDTALDAAMAQALGALTERSSDEREKRRLGFRARYYAARVSPQPAPPGFAESCLGAYGTDIHIVSKDGMLRFLRGGTNRELRYIGDETFLVDGRSDYRLRFRTQDGTASSCEVVWFDDTEDRYPRAR